MIWGLLFISLLFHSFIQSQDNSLQEKSELQVRHYIESVTQNNNRDINLWALAEASKNNPALQSYISSYLSTHNYNQPALQIFQDTSFSYIGKLKQLAFKAESPLLLATYLVQEPDKSIQKKVYEKFQAQIGFPSSKIKYGKIIETLLQKGSIDSTLLPNKKFSPIHFFLFSNNSVMRTGTFSEEYLETVAKEWKFSNQASLEQSLGLASLLKVFWELYKYQQIEQLYNPIINNSLFPNSLIKLNVFRSLGYSMYHLGYYSRSLNIIRNYSIPLAQYLEKKETEIKLRMAEGAYLYRIGKIEQSKQVNLNIQEKAKKENIPISWGRLYNNLAIDYWKSGEFNRYTELQFEALNLARKENSYDTKFDILKNLFTHYRVNKDFESANNYLNKAKTLAEQEDNKHDLAQLSFLEGSMYRDSEGNYDKALKSFNNALSLITFENNYHSYLNILSEKARLLEEQQRLESANNIYKQILEKAKERKDPPNKLFASFNIANTYLSLEKQDSAKAILDTLDTKNLDPLDFYQLVKARTVQARYQKITGHPNKGTEILRPALQQIVRRSRASGTLETGFWQVEPEYLDAFDLYTNLLIETDQNKKAVEVLDQLKTINDAAIYQNPLVRSKVLTEKELGLYTRLTENLDELRKQLLTASPGQQNSIQQKINKLSAQKNALDRKITLDADLKPVSVDQIQRHMNAHQRVLHITELNEKYYVATIARNTVEFNKIDLTKERRASFETSIEEMATGHVNLKKLFKFSQLIELNQLPEHVQELTIIPDSYLYQLPLDVFPLEEPEKEYSYGQAAFLIKRFETSYMTSLNDFNKMTNVKQGNPDYAGYGVSNFDDDRKSLVPLPEAKTEIVNIADELTEFKQKKTFLNDAATEESFRETAPGARILHLATHSEVANQDPLFSSIYFSKMDSSHQTKFPGRIFAYELFELNLSNELVMLNSCESGSGSYLQGTGVVGISRALRYAGAQSLVLNLWSVNDMMASEFAVKFYEGINKGQSKSEALRNAKIFFLNTKNANPHYWGSYMLLGNNQPIIKPDYTLNNMVAGSFMLFFMGIAIASSFVEMRRRHQKM